jgi:hypothetical protein
MKWSEEGKARWWGWCYKLDEQMKRDTIKDGRRLNEVEIIRTMRRHDSECDLGSRVYEAAHTQLEAKVRQRRTFRD